MSDEILELLIFLSSGFFHEFVTILQVENYLGIELRNRHVYFDTVLKLSRKTSWNMIMISAFLYDSYFTLYTVLLFRTLNL